MSPLPTVSLTAELAAQALRTADFSAGSNAWGYLPALLARQAAATPNDIAVVYNDIQLTYAALFTEADALVGELLRRGAGPGTVVGVSLRRSERLVVALLAVLRSGAAYLPIDPDLPCARVAAMVTDARPLCVVTTVHDRPRVVEVPLQYVDVDVAPDHNGPTERSCDDALAPLYVLYTSGSTGNPKGVVIPHSAIANRLLWMQHYFGIGAGDRVLQKTPYTFDVSVWEFFWPLISGATLVVCPPEAHRDPLRLAQIIQRDEVDTVHFVPSMLRLFLDEPAAAVCGSLRRVICSGEVLTPDLRDRFHQVFDLPLYNLYGPTEAAVDVSFFECKLAQPFDPVPIGRPITNIELKVLDANLRPVAAMEPGELYISGVGLAHGYLGQPGLTAERFVPTPDSEPSARMYRTGDLARWSAHDELEFLGRVDHQVQVHGVRIELGEIEAALASWPDTRAAAAAVHDDKLIGYVVTGSVTERVAQWTEVFESSYAQPMSTGDLDLRGWISSIDGRLLPEAGMREWLDNTVAHMPGTAGSVLEIGCGTGLLADQLLRRCSSYVGTDVAAAELDRLRRRLDAQWPGRAELVALPADQVAAIDGEFDLVVLNSVVQYFPDANYLTSVLEQALAKCLPDGAMFIGDVRHRDLARLLYAERAAIARPGASRAEIEELIVRFTNREKELLIRPEFFALFASDRGIGADHIEIRPKSGRYDNELSRYRYDVVIRAGYSRSQTKLVPTHDWPISVPDLLRSAPPQLILSAVPNARLDTAKAILGENDPLGIHPDDLVAVAADHGYTAVIDWRVSRPDGSFDVALSRIGIPTPVPIPPVSAPGDLHDHVRVPRREAISLPRNHSIWSHLAGLLPDYMTPSRVLATDELPLTSSGKLDRRALRPPAKPVVAALDRPTTDDENALCELFAETLGIDMVGVNDNFLELGGDSITAVELLGQARTRLGSVLTLQDVMGLGTVRAITARSAIAVLPANMQLAESLRGAEGFPLSPVPSDEIEDLPMSMSEIEDVLPLAPLQEGLLFHSALAEESPDVYVIRIEADILALTEPNALRVAAEAAIKDHPALRTSFHYIGLSKPVQVVHKRIPLSWRDVDVRDMTPSQATATYDQLVTDEMSQGFAVEATPLIRFIAVRMGDRRYRLVVGVHHIVLDGWSISIFLQDVVDRCRVHPTRRADFDLRAYYGWLRARNRSSARAAWARELAALPGVTLLSPTASKSEFPAQHQLLLSVHESEQLHTAAHARALTTNAVCTATWGVLLGGLTDAQEALFGTSVAGRPPEIEGIARSLGMFMNTVPVRVTWQPGESITVVARRRQLARAGLFEHEYLSLSDIQREVGRRHLFDTYLNYENYPKRVDPPTESRAPRLVDFRVFDWSHYPLAVLIAPAESITFTFEYQTGVFDSDTVTRISTSYLDLIRGFIQDPDRPIT